MQELLAVLPDWLGVYLLIVNVATIAASLVVQLARAGGLWLR